jgi:hypothetical protein
VIILKVWIISPLKRLSFKVGIFNFFSLSGYSISVKDGICTFSMLSMSCCLYSDQTAAAYSRCGLTSAWSYAHLGRWMFFWWGPLCLLPYLFSAVYVVNNLIGHQLRHLAMSFSPSELCSSISFPLWGNNKKINSSSVLRFSSNK